MSIDAWIMTLPAISAGIVTIIARKAATRTNATPKDMPITKNTRQPVHHVHSAEDYCNDRKPRSPQSQSMDSIRVNRYEISLLLAHTPSVITPLVIWSIIILWTKQPYSSEVKSKSSATKGLDHS